MLIFVLFHLNKFFFFFFAGLFKNAILQSGSPTAHWAYHNTTANLKRQAHLAFKKSSCNRSTLQASISCLRNVSVKSLLKLQLKFIEDRVG